jgi:hypothetical protein
MSDELYQAWKKARRKIFVDELREMQTGEAERTRRWNVAFSKGIIKVQEDTVDVQG